MKSTAEYMSIDSEYQLFREISINLKNKIERSVYNKRKRQNSPPNKMQNWKYPKEKMTE